MLEDYSGADVTQSGIVDVETTVQRVVVNPEANAQCGSIDIEIDAQSGTVDVEKCITISKRKFVSIAM